MPVCVLVLNERIAADRLRLSLQDQGTPLLRVVLVAPAPGKGSEPKEQQSFSDSDLPEEAMDDVDLLNPSLARRRRQKSMARWLMQVDIVHRLCGQIRIREGLLFFWF